jgi:hypothetical protein
MVFYALGAMLTHSDDRKAAREILSVVEGDEGSTSPFARASVKQLGERMDKARWFGEDA